MKYLFRRITTKYQQRIYIAWPLSFPTPLKLGKIVEVFLTLTGRGKSEPSGESRNGVRQVESGWGKLDRIGLS